MRKQYRTRRETLIDALHKHLGDAVEFDVPNGGMALWAHADHCSDVNAWASRALAKGVRVSPASFCRLDRRNSGYMRVGFAKLNTDKLSRAVQLVAGSMKS